MKFFYSLYYIPKAPVAILPIGITEMEKKKDLIFLTQAKYLIFSDIDIAVNKVGSKSG